MFTLKAQAKKKTRAKSIARTLKRSEGATRQKAFSLGLSLESRGENPPLTALKAEAEKRAERFLSVPRNSPQSSSRLAKTSRLLANRRRPRRRCRMILLVLGEDRFEGFFRPEFRRANFFQAGGIPI
jgi:hypothetical protein